MARKKKKWYSSSIENVKKFFRGFNFDRYVTLVSGVAISIMAAWYSIVGLAAIFSGAAFSIMLMGAALEAGKVVAASYLFRNWGKLNYFFRGYLIAAVTVLMAITSMGIFGYLSKAHIEQSVNISYAQERADRINRSIERIQDRILQKERELEQVNAAIDSMINSNFASRAITTQERQTERIETINSEIENFESQIIILEEERAPFDQQIRSIEREVGPIRYVAELLFGESNKELLERAVQYMIIFLVLVFDPLAIILIMLATRHQEDYIVKTDYENEAKEWMNLSPRRRIRSNAVATDGKTWKDTNVEVIERLR